LNQNPEFFASSTSALPATLGGVSAFWSQAPEIRSDLAHDSQATKKRLSLVLRGIAESWYADCEQPVVFDKSRGWITLIDTLNKLFPDARCICMVRDPRHVFASIQKHHQDFPLLSDMGQATVFSQADAMFGPQGMIGGPLTHIEDHLRRRTQNVVPVIFEAFVKDPERELRKVYAECKLDWFDEHDFEHVESTATDLDALYLDKFPHDGSGPVAEPSDNWQEFVPPDIASAIINRYPGYARAFGYQ
jgi:sulfotransferase